MKKITSKKEQSAGGLIVSKKANGWWVLLMKDKNGKWTFPKGKIEKNEDYLTAAKREIREEVGIEGLTQMATLSPISYWYFRNGSIHKTVQYFLFKTAQQKKPVAQTDEGILDAAWVRLKLAKNLIGYPKTNLPLLIESEAVLSVQQ